MSKCKKSSGYDITMTRLSLRRKDQWPVRFPFPTEKAAKDWRFSFYAFRAALQRENDSRYLNIAAVQVRLEGTEAVLDHMDNSEQSRIMQAILDGTVGAPGAPTPLAPSNTGERRAPTFHIPALGDVMSQYYTNPQGASTETTTAEPEQDTSEPMSRSERILYGKQP